MKLVEKNKNNYTYLKDKNKGEENIYNNQYILYMKLHEYNKALKMIKDHLAIESNPQKIEVLEKNRDICLNGLCDWEQLFDNEENINFNLGYESDSKSENDSNSGSKEEKEDKEQKENKEGENKIENKENEEDINKIIDKEILLSKACMNLSKWSQLKIHFSKIQRLFKNDKDIYEKLIMTNKNDIFMMDFNENEEEEDEVEQNNFYHNHGIIKNKINDILSDETDNYNKYLLINNYKSRKKINTGDIIQSTGIHRFSDRGSAFGLPELFKDSDFIAYHEVISKNPNFSFLEGNSEILFDLDLYSIILNINNGQFDIALRFIDSAKKKIIGGIKSLLSESYVRGYELLVKNQLLFQLEQIIEYKQYHEKDEDYLKEMISIWDKNLSNIGKDPAIYEKILALRSLILPLEDEYGNYLNLAKIYRKLNMYEQSEKILNRVRAQFKLDSFDLGTNNYTLMNRINGDINSNRLLGNDTIIELNDDDSNKSEFKLIKNNLFLTKKIKTEIELSYNQCLYEKGKVNEAIEKSKYLVDLLDKSQGNSNYSNDLINLTDKIKSKIYGNYAIYKQNKFHKNLNEISLKNNANRLIFTNNNNNINDKMLNTIRKTHSIGLGKKTNHFKFWMLEIQ